MESLKQRYKDYFCIGAAVNARAIRTHADLLARHFDSLTCENEMKWGVVAPDGGNYGFAGADAIRDFAAQNRMGLRLHTLLWHNQTPAGFFEGKDAESLARALEGHIAQMARRYGGGVYACDVANEVVADSNGKARGDLRLSPWLEIGGEEIIDRAFYLAREALPGVKLFYNDYNECDPEKSGRIYRLVRGMIDRGVPVDGLGLQCHWNVSSPAMDEMRRAFELYAGLGLELQITEMDVSLYPGRGDPGMARPAPELLARQAQVYGRAFELFREYRDVVTCVTTWGVADDDTWLDNFPQPGRKNWPLLFDEQHRPKEAFRAVMDF